ASRKAAALLLTAARIFLKAGEPEEAKLCLRKAVIGNDFGFEFNARPRAVPSPKGIPPALWKAALRSSKPRALTRRREQLRRSASYWAGLAASFAAAPDPIDREGVAADL